MTLQEIDIPFNCRFTCWFCSEGSHQVIITKIQTAEQAYPANVPICDECKSYQCHQNISSLKRIKALIKEKIVSRYAKELSIGANWTEQELEESDLNGSAFDGFKKSAWPMYLIAKARLNYEGWPLAIGGITLEDILLDEKFEFDGLSFTSLTLMLDYLSKSFRLNKEFLRRVLVIYGNDKAIKAVKFCRLLLNNSEYQRENAITDLIKSLR